MKTISFQKRNALFSTSGFSTWVLVIFFVCTLVVLRIFFPGVFFFAAAPLLTSGAYLTELVSGVRASFADQATLMRERDTLRASNAALQNANLTLTARIDDLSALFDGNSAEPRGIVAAVLSRPPQSPYDTLVISAGSTSGVSTGMRVRGAGNAPLGEVVSVTATSARIVLYSSPGKTLSAWVGASRTPVTLVGAGGGAFMASAPKASGVAEGDAVYLGEGQASVVGLVRKVEADLASPSATLLIASLVNPFSTLWVTLLP